jgi:hypothetical protein
MTAHLRLLSCRWQWLRSESLRWESFEQPRPLSRNARRTGTSTRRRPGWTSVSRERGGARVRGSHVRATLDADDPHASGYSHTLDSRMGPYSHRAQLAHGPALPTIVEPDAWRSKRIGALRPQWLRPRSRVRGRSGRARPATAVLGGSRVKGARTGRLNAPAAVSEVAGGRSAERDRCPEAG